MNALTVLIPYPSDDGLSYKVRKPLCSKGQIILP